MADFHSLALSLTPGLGGTLCRRLASLARPADLFAMSRPQLAALLGPSHPAVAAILGRNGLARAESELRICEQHHIKPLFFTDPDFPRRLNTADTADCPALLYTLGDADLNAERTVAVVGTRRATPVGKANTEALVGGMRHLASPVVSGLAYGIDTAAHTAALAAGLPTVAVLGHGLDRIYPPANRNLAAQIIAAGGALVTEYPFGSSPPATASSPPWPTPRWWSKPQPKAVPSSPPPSPPATTDRSSPSPDASATPTPKAPTPSSPPTRPSLSAMPTTSPPPSTGPSRSRSPLRPRSFRNSPSPRSGSANSSPQTSP